MQKRWQQLTRKAKFTIIALAGSLSLLITACSTLPSCRFGVTMSAGPSFDIHLDLSKEGTNAPPR